MSVLQDKVAIVTGGAGGVGRGICTAFAREGARVAIVDINESGAAALATELESVGAQALAIPCDISDADEITKAVEETVDWFGTVDILVNNAQAGTHDVALEDMTDADFDVALATGPTATFRFMKACHPYLVDGGRVINLRSGAEVVAMPNRAGYNTAKGAIAALTKSAAREWGRHGITVNCLSPFVLHDKAKEFFEDHPDELEGLLAGVSIPRSGDAETDVGRVAVFLAGPDASFVTGCTVTADGGGAFVG
jgi:NAD(P)-dependent dehydrogenase (short-subunit alcohol dehydrogenase family)